MALETKPDWLIELEARLERPYTDDELARLREWGESLKRLNDGQTWPAGTFDRLLQMGDVEDAEDEAADRAAVYGC